jgi:KaiC/GvpD/RAD55 family RecA-like ATPase
MTEEIQEYNKDIQELYLRMMVTDAGLFTRVRNILNSDNFDKSLKPAVKFITDFSESHMAIPDIAVIKATTGLNIEPIPSIRESDVDWFMTSFEKFTKRQELERAIFKSAELLEKGDFGPVEKLIKDAVQIGLQKDLGTDYFNDPGARLKKYFDNGGQVSTGWPQLDRLLYGGFSRGELNIFAGGSGSGKSLVMMNIALNWLQQGLNGVYISLELSEELTGLRSDAMLTNSSTKDIRKDIDNTSLKISMIGKKYGTYQIKALPAQSNVNDIRSFLKEYQIKTGHRVDFMMVDYLDLVMPVSVKVNPNDQFIKDKYVSEELRNLAKELGILMVTASQLNRSAVEESEFDHSHIAGGISKINTADNVFGIFTSRSMKERGKYQIQCMKSRSSTGVGQKIDLEYNMETMRITDEGGDGENGQTSSGVTNSILNRIKTGSSVKPTYNADTSSNTVDESTGEIRNVKADVQSSKLASMLSKMKSGN